MSSNLKIKRICAWCGKEFIAQKTTTACCSKQCANALYKKKKRDEAIKALFFKSVLPVTVALILYCIFKSACMKNGELDYVWLWILCGLPFGLHRMCLWIVPGGGSLGGGIALFALNFIIGGVIGGFILAWRLIVAVWYVPLTVYRLIVG